MTAALALLRAGLLSAWQSAFVVGCCRQVLANRELSDKQIAVMNKLGGQA